MNEKKKKHQYDLKITFEFEMIFLGKMFTHLDRVK